MEETLLTASAELFTARCPSHCPLHTRQASQ